MIKFKTAPDPPQPTLDARLQEDIQKKCQLYFQLHDRAIAPLPEKTSVWCWWDAHPFETIPIGIPKRYKPSLNLVEVWGVFCSFECAQAYINDTHEPSSLSLYFLYTIMQHDVRRSSRTFQPAPSRYVLKAFGGPIEISDFRSASTSCTRYELIRGAIGVHQVAVNTYSKKPLTPPPPAPAPPVAPPINIIDFFNS